MNLDSSSNLSSYVDCGEDIKIETIKEEMNEEESVEDPLSIHDESVNSEDVEYLVDNHEEELNEGDAGNDNIEEENIVNENNDVNVDEEQVQENLQVNENEEVDIVDEELVPPNNEYQNLGNMSVEEALAFFSS